MDSAQPILIPTGGRRVLFAVASEIELNALVPDHEFPVWKAVEMHDSFDIVRTGVGKANAAGGVASAIDPQRHAGVISFGIGGSLPGSGLAIGTLAVATESVFSDEGIGIPTGFCPLTSLGFHAGIDGDEVRGDPDWVQAFAGGGAEPVRVATVSTCSGTDDLALEIMRRSDAGIEAMEGAAMGVAANRAGVRFCELRVVSNTTGHRDRQDWNLPVAFAKMASVMRRIRTC